MIPNSFSELRVDAEDRTSFRRVPVLCMLPEDAVAFSKSLQAAFPAIRFVSVAYWEQFVDQERWKADCAQQQRLEAMGIRLRTLRKHMRDPTQEPLHYWQSLSDPAETRFYAWIEPPGWRPRWGPENESGERRIENTPRLWFEFHRSWFQRKWPNGGWMDVEPRPVSARDTVVLHGHEFIVRWNPREPEAEAFAKTVYGILRKLTGCNFMAFEAGTRKAFDGASRHTPKRLLAGRHALAWSLRRRHNYLTGSGDYLRKPASFELRPGDVFTKSELRQWVAKNEREREEHFRLHKEALARFHCHPGGDTIVFKQQNGKFVRGLLYERQAESPAHIGAPRVALELRVRRRGGRAEWSVVRKPRAD
jgi:hypothetical protein